MKKVVSAVCRYEISLIEAIVKATYSQLLNNCPILNYLSLLAEIFRIICNMQSHHF